MRKSVFGAALATFLLAAVHVCQAQQAKNVPRIGFLWASSGPSPNAPTGIHQGLRKLGYNKGKNLTIEYRYAKGKFERLPVFAPSWFG
jgi:putative ABC transport system substrate-binding protein